MRCLGRLIGLGLVLTFLLVFPCSLWTFNTQRIALDVQTYKRAFADEGFYEDLIPTVLPALLKGLQEPPPAPGTVSFPDLIDHLKSRDWNAIAPGLVPMDWAEYEIETNLDNFSTWMEGDRDDLVMAFHTDTLRRRLEGSAGETAMQQIMDALPPCDAPRENQFDDFVAGEPGAMFPFCRPEDDARRAELVRILDETRLSAAAALPDQLDVIDEMEKASLDHPEPGEQPFTRNDLDVFRAIVRLWQGLLMLWLIFPIMVLALVIIFAVRSAKTFFRWIGWSLILGSLVALIPLVILPFILHDLINVEGEIEGGFAAGGALMAEIAGRRMTQVLIREFTWPVLIEAAILIGVGFFAVVLSVLLPDPDSPPDELVAVTSTGPVTPALPPAAEYPTRLDAAPPVDPISRQENSS